MRLLRLLWAFVVRDAKIAFSYRLQFFFQSASVLSLSITFFFLSLMMKGVEGGIVALDRYGGGYFGFVLVGIAFSTYLDAALRTFSASVRQAQITGTLEAMLTTSSPIGAMVFGSALYTLLFTTARVGLFLFLGVFMFGLRLHGEAWLGAVTVVALTVTATFALGIFAAGFIVLFKQGDPVSAAVNGLSWLLSGVLYPKEILPAWVQDVADLLPMTHTLEAVRLAILTGAPLADLMGAVTYLGGFSAVGIPVSLLWFSWAVKQARVAGSLASY